MAGEIKKTESAGGVVLNSKGEILVVNQNHNSWSLPKGHVDTGEDALEAAKREIYEESGIESLEYISELGRYERYRIGKNGGDDMTELKGITMFLFKTLLLKLAPIDSNNPEARWVRKEDVSALLTHPKDKEFFESIISQL